jgi:alpha-tubulin suppressor-like RCC1 family protein
VLGGKALVLGAMVGFGSAGLLAACDEQRAATEPEIADPSESRVEGDAAASLERDAGGDAFVATDAPPPVEAAPRGGTLAGNYHTVCTVRASGKVVCWGWGGSGQFGVTDGGTGPVTLPGIADARTVAPAIDFTCVGLAGGTVRCLGGNEPSALEGLTDVVYVQAGYRYACALRTGGAVSCWGTNAEKELGPRAEGLRQSPTPIAVTEGATSLSVGSTHACIVKSNGGVACWGLNDSGQLGVPAGPAMAAPVEVPGVRGVAMVAAAVNMTCALQEDGTVTCWGCENGGGACSLAPHPMPGISGARWLAAGAFHACVVREDRKVACWGVNAHSQLGADTPERTVTPVVPGIDDAVAVSTGAETSCALRAGGHVSCWGENHIGQLGSLDAGPKSARPVAVPGL